MTKLQGSHSPFLFTFNFPKHYLLLFNVGLPAAAAAMYFLPRVVSEMSHQL